MRTKRFIQFGRIVIKKNMFLKYWFRHSKAIRGRDPDSQRGCNSYTPTLGRQAKRVSIFNFWTLISSILGRIKRCLLHNVQTTSWVHPASYIMGTGAVSLGLKRQVRAEVKNGVAILPLPIRLQGVVLM
jgi:hypothetical protein